MSGVSVDLEFVADSAERMLDGLRSDPRLTDDIADRPGKELAAYVRAMLDQVEQAIGELRQQVEDEVDLENNAKGIRLLNLFVAGDMARALPWLDARAPARLPLGVRYLIHELADKIVKHEIDPVIVAGTQYGADPRPFLSSLRHLTTHGIGLQLPSYDSSTLPVLLYFPERALQSVLLHGLLAHELAHSAMLEHSFMSNIMSELKTSQEWNEALYRALEEDQPGSSGPAINVAREHLVEMIDSWVEEVLCDAVALRVLGPSYLFSFAAQVLTGPPVDSWPRHPPACVRVELMLAALGSDDGQGWRATLEDGELEGLGVGEILEWLENVSKGDLSQLLSSRLMAVKVVRERAETIYAEVDEYLGEAVYRPDQYVPLHYDLQQHLEQRILPCQLSTSELPGGAVDRRAILLAAWLYILGKSDHPSALARALDEEGLQIFVTRALEMSRVLEEWQAKP